VISEEIVSELVHGFLLPEVQKQAMRDKGKLHLCRALLRVSGELIYGTSMEVVFFTINVYASSCDPTCCRELI
jgi:hypothetical protein